MLIRPIFLCGVVGGCLLVVSCSSLKLGKNKAEAANPYEDVPNGGYDPGNFQDGGAGYAANSGGATSRGYDRAYGRPTHDEVNVVPFTDSGGDSARTEPPAKRETASIEKRNRPPSSSRSGTNKSSSVAAASRATSGASSGKLKKTVYRSDDEPSPKLRRAEQKVHIVKPGETLYRLSRTYGVSVQRIKKRNQLDSDLIRVGEELVIQ
jgi:LysM repeat protein